MKGDEHVNRYYEGMVEFYEGLKHVMEHMYRKGRFSRGKWKLRMMLYDVTSKYMEEKRCGIARHGYSRDHRHDRQQIVIGVMLDEEGWPVDYGIWEGNRQDASTVLEMVKRVRERFGVEEVVFVRDRCMVRKGILRDFEKMGVKYIVAMNFFSQNAHSSLSRKKSAERL